jgi:hypothetical protein
MWADQESDYVHVHYAVTNTIHASQTQAHFKSPTYFVLHLLLSNCDNGTDVKRGLIIHSKCNKCCDEEANTIPTAKAIARAEKYCNISSHKE